MTDEEAQNVLDNLARNLVRIGEEETADQTGFVEHDENGFLRARSAKERLIDTIEALERTMALDDIATYKKARGLLVENVADASAVAVVVRPSVETPESAGAPEGTYYLADGLANLGEERAQLRKIAKDLRARFTPRREDD